MSWFLLLAFKVVGVAGGFDTAEHFSLLIFGHAVTADFFRRGGADRAHDISGAGIYGVDRIRLPGRSQAMSLIDAIDNLYEKLVADAIDETRQPGDDDDFLADVICVALNRLPSKYYRHSVDMVFYMAEGEMDAMKKDSRGAVRDAREFVSGHRRED